MAVRKSKLTLTVDAGTVEKAKRLGINISELTEKVLRGWVFDPHDESRDALLDHYKAMFDTMIPLLKEYDVTVHVADYYITFKDTLGRGKPHLETVTEEIFLQPGGQFWFPEMEVAVRFEELRKETELHFLDPEEVLQNFIGALEKGKARRHERLESLEVARRLIDAIVKIEAEPGTKKAAHGSGPSSTQRRRHAGRR